VIKVKENAPDLLRRALSRVPVDAIATGDYQAAEKKFEVSRRMLEVCLELGFPVSVLERSPLVLRDLDWKDEGVNDGFGQAAPVGSYAAGASPYGVLDLAGNVWEWVADRYDDGVLCPVASPKSAGARVGRRAGDAGWFGERSFLRGAPGRPLCRYPR
jgi:Sulfatase-modifying factor enzyme 1